jgi:hypothetical protein
MKNGTLILAGALVVLVGVLAWLLMQADRTTDDPAGVETPTAEEAEQVGFAFINDVVLLAPPATNEEVADRVYSMLSTRARESVERDMLSRDMAFFVGIQDVPDLGVSIEDLLMNEDGTATLILGLNYSGGPTIRAITMVAEDGEWKVDAVDALDTYPPEPTTPIDADPVTTEPGTDDTDTPTPPVADNGTVTTPPVAGGCYVGGCSSEVCSDQPDVVSPCIWMEEFACYRDAVCERQAGGDCGWTQTPELLMCLAEAQEEGSEMVY